MPMSIVCCYIYKYKQLSVSLMYFNFDNRYVHKLLIDFYVFV